VVRAYKRLRRQQILKRPFILDRFIADQDGPKVADEFYRYLSGKDHEFREGQKSKLNTSEAARALHSAVQKLRSEGVPLHRWVPFIYVGK